MNTYNWRKNFTADYSNLEQSVRGKLAVKTKELHWLETTKPVIIPVSIHSIFHEEVGGHLKMNALLSTIKNHVKGKVTVLLADRAHLQTISLNHQGNLKLAFDECLEEAKAIALRYQSYFEDCEVVYWHSYISQDSKFLTSLDSIKDAYETNQIFRELVDQDAESTYTCDRRGNYPNKNLFIEKAREDILEQCASILVLSEKGYAFQFYPGLPFLSVEYVNRTFISEDKRIPWINVFVSIEKKTIISEKKKNIISEKKADIPELQELGLS